MTGLGLKQLLKQQVSLSKVELLSGFPGRLQQRLSMALTPHGIAAVTKGHHQDKRENRKPTLHQRSLRTQENEKMPWLIVKQVGKGINEPSTWRSQVAAGPVLDKGNPQGRITNGPSSGVLQLI